MTSLNFEIDDAGNKFMSNLKFKMGKAEITCNLIVKFQLN